MPEFFSRMHVREMDFDCRDPTRDDCISQSHAGVRISGGIENYDVNLPPAFLDPSNQLALHVRLSKSNLQVELLGTGANGFLDFGQCNSTVSLGLPLTEQVQVGTIKEQDPHAGAESRFERVDCPN